MKQLVRSVFVILLILWNVGISVAQNQAETEREWSIDNCVNQFSFNDTVSTKVGYQYWFADKKFLDGQTLKMSVVAPHSATHAPHIHLEDEFFFVLEGEALLILGEDSIVAKPYASFYCPTGIKHGIRNIGDTELKYLVIKKYLQK
ncbi:MAG: cupin domain-containing protein [Prolixibacteraceae bacterium]|jgi:mannose-6-phosphate isomerase-like protein (cupin superfamily)|nr:cupin domain-containing protein [Prolixibacteraceae bacterium]